MNNSAARAEPLLDSLYAERRVPFWQQLRGKIVITALGSCIATAIMQFAHIKQGILYACSAATYFGGDPLRGEEGIFKKAGKRLGELGKKIEGKIPNRHIPTPLPVLHKTTEQLETEARLKEEREERQNESERKVVVARLEKLGVPFDPEASLEALQVELKEAEDTQRKRPLMEKADAMGLRVDPKEPYDVLHKRIKEAEADADFQEKVREYERRVAQRQQIIDTYNARCPNPKCRRAFKTMAKTGNFLCPRCRTAFTPRQARACWVPPPMPPYPKRNASVMDRVNGLKGMLFK
jgi:hypothetical protein